MSIYERGLSFVKEKIWSQGKKDKKPTPPLDRAVPVHTSEISF
jgi:hypothetical protein